MVCLQQKMGSLLQSIRSLQIRVGVAGFHDIVRGMVGLAQTIERHFECAPNAGGQPQRLTIAKLQCALKYAKSKRQEAVQKVNEVYESTRETKALGPTYPIQ